MAKLNCFEFQQCGRESSDGFFGDEDTCPTSTKQCTNGVNDGVNGGRACWAIAGSFCGGEAACTFARQVKSCLDCDFYQMVRAEEGDKFVTGSELTDLIQWEEKILGN